MSVASSFGDRRRRRPIARSRTYGFNEIIGDEPFVGGTSPRVHCRLSRVLDQPGERFLEGTAWHYQTPPQPHRGQLSPSD